MTDPNRDVPEPGEEADEDASNPVVERAKLPSGTVARLYETENGRFIEIAQCENTRVNFTRITPTDAEELADVLGRWG